MDPPLDYDTFYTAIFMADKEAENVGLTIVFVTFDLPLYMKAADITTSLCFFSIFFEKSARLRGFHVVMSFWGPIDYIMADSGSQELLNIVNAENKVVMFMDVQSEATCQSYSSL